MPLHQRLETALPPTCAMRSVNVGFCFQCNSMFILTGVCPKPYKSHRLCLHMILELCIQGLSHGCVSLQETDHAPTVPHAVQVSCALSMYTLAPAFYQAIVLSTRHCSAIALPDLNMAMRALQLMTLLLLATQAVCTHALQFSGSWKSISFQSLGV